MVLNEVDVLQPVKIDDEVEDDDEVDEVDEVEGEDDDLTLADQMILSSQDSVLNKNRNVLRSIHHRFKKENTFHSGGILNCEMRSMLLHVVVEISHQTKQFQHDRWNVPLKSIMEAVMIQS